MEIKFEFKDSTNNIVKDEWRQSNKENNWTLCCDAAFGSQGSP